MKLVMSHELGHAIMHRKLNCYFIRNKTLLLDSKIEIEANTFAVNLLISDETIIEIIDNQNCTLEYMSRMLGYNQKLIELRLKTFDIDKKQILRSYSLWRMEKQNKKPLYGVFRYSKWIITHWRYEKRIQS